MLRIGIVAGEVSGDLLAARLMVALQDRFSDIEFTGIAGPSMIRAGCKPIFRADSLSVMGLAEVLGHLPNLLFIRREIYRYFISKQPDLFIGVDAPDFNLGLAKKLHRSGIPTVHYVSPSVWAWRPGRVREIVQYVDRVLTLFPFEANLYNRFGNHARFVGHPLADEISGSDGTQNARNLLAIDRHGPVLAVLPGSRESEVSRLGDTFAKTIKILRKSYPGMACVAPMVNSKLATQFRFCLDRAGIVENFKLVDGMAREALTAADVVLTASGTACLEAMLVNRPMVVAYRISPITHFIVKALRLLKVGQYSLPNILANEEIVPELMQSNAVPEKIAATLTQLLQNDEARRAQTVRFRALHEELRCNASVQAAQAIGELLAENDRSLRE
ncbi:MAG: lipid-A-disaccharide synthase [Gammaproteobacteria bacterium]